MCVLFTVSLCICILCIASWEQKLRHTRLRNKKIVRSYSMHIHFRILVDWSRGPMHIRIHTCIPCRNCFRCVMDESCCIVVIENKSLHLYSNSVQIILFITWTRICVYLQSKLKPIGRPVIRLVHHPTKTIQAWDKNRNRSTSQMLLVSAHNQCQHERGHAFDF